MDEIIYAVLLSLTSSIVLTSIFINFYYHYREKYIAVWLVNGFITILGNISILLMGKSYHLSSKALYLCIALGNTFLLFWGTRLFLKKKWSKFWLFGIFICGLWSIICELYLSPFWIITIIPCLYLGILNLNSGIQFLTSRDIIGIGKNLLGISIILLGFHNLDYIFLGDSQIFAPWGFLIVSIIMILLSIGMILTYYEKVATQLKIQDKFLIEAKNSAEAANEIKSIFITNMSHDLRTPLNAIIGFSEVLYDETLGPLNESQKNCLNDIMQSGTHLVQLIDDLLDLSLIEKNKIVLNIERISIKILINNVIRIFERELIKRQITYQFDIDDDNLIITTDQRRIKQVLINLLSNAIKFSPDNSRIGIRVIVEGQNVKITVWDTGIGIAKENQKKLFLPYQRIETTLNKHIPGIGIGLNSSKKIIELCGGYISVKSELGIGSEFSIIIPINQNNISSSTLQTNSL